MDKDWVITVKWWKKWKFMIFWVAAGIIYLSEVDGWQVYAKPIEQVKSWYESIKQDFRQADYVQASGNPLWNTVSGTEGAVSGADGMFVSSGDRLQQVGAEAPDTGVQDPMPDAAESGTPESSQTGEINAPESGIPDAAGAGASHSSEPPDNRGTGGHDSPEPGMPGGWEAGDGPETDGAMGWEAQNVLDYQSVEDDYFGDAVFIGDSRTVGMFEYGGLEETAAFYAAKGLTIYKLFDSEIVTVAGQKKKITVEQALSEHSYAKIYLMVGINEMGTGTVETFAAAYKEAVDHLLELQPDAIIYIQGIIKVTSERSQQGDYINNEGIEARNEAISQLADNERVFYLDVNPAICDETGGMNPIYTFDGVHLKAQYIDLWKGFLKQHAILR